MGQGLTTVLAQIAAEELGLPFERVRVLLSDTDLTPDGGPTTASRQTFITGNAARLAAQGMREQLARVAAEQWDVPPDAIRFEDGELGADGRRATLAEAVEWLIAEGREPRLTYHYHAPADPAAGQRRRHALCLWLCRPGGRRWRWTRRPARCRCCASWRRPTAGGRSTRWRSAARSRAASSWASARR